jgi:hypothetical protein
VLLEVLLVLGQGLLALGKFLLLLLVLFLDALDSLILLFDQLLGLVSLGLSFGEFQEQLFNLLFGGIRVFYRRCLVL